MFLTCYFCHLYPIYTSLLVMSNYYSSCFSYIISVSSMQIPVAYLYIKILENSSVFYAWSLYSLNAACTLEASFNSDNREKVNLKNIFRGFIWNMIFPAGGLKYTAYNTFTIFSSLTYLLFILEQSFYLVIQNQVCKLSSSLPLYHTLVQTSFFQWKNK